MQLPLIKGNRKSKTGYRDNLPVNFTAVFYDIDGDQGYLLTHDGLTEFAQVNGKARGGWYSERLNKHYRVSGNAFEEIATDGTVSVLGVITGDDVVSFAESFNSIAIVASGHYYSWDGATLTDVLDPELGFPIDNTWFSQIFVFTDGEFVFHTDINNEQSISPLKYSSSEFAADPVLGVARRLDQIVAFNRYSIEWFYFNASAGTGLSVLQNIPNKTIRAGIVGTHCKCILDDVFFILGGRKEESPSIHYVTGLSINSIATREVDKIISEYNEAELSTVVMETRVVDRDKFIIVHLPNETLLYNHTIAQQVGLNNAWSFVKTGISTDEPWRAKFGVFDPRITKWIYGDTKEDKLGYLDQDSAAQYDEDSESICYSPILSDLERMSITEFELDTMPGYSPKNVICFHSQSFDGVIYGTERSEVISSEDNYNTRFLVRDRTYVRDSFNYKFRVVSDSKVAFSDFKVKAV